MGVLAALFAGAVSFLSPCVLPLAPGYLSAVTGISANSLGEASTRLLDRLGLKFFSDV